MAGKLLGIPDGELLHSFPQQFITRLVQAGSNSHQSRRVTTYKCACTVSQAREQRDCFVKALYNRLVYLFASTMMALCSLGCYIWLTISSFESVLSYVGVI